jgi:hypothetical protein
MKDLTRRDRRATPGAVRGRGRAKLSQKKNTFVREKRDKPGGQRFHSGMRVAKSFVLSKVLKFYG